MAVMILHWKPKFTGETVLRQQPGVIDALFVGRMILHMKRSALFAALPIGIALSGFLLASCETTQSRISKHPEIYQNLSANDQALVSRGQIRAGMPQNAVWLAWGSPDRKITGNMRGHATETWIYVTYETVPYPYYGPRWGYGYGFGGGVAVVHRRHGGRSFVFFGDPFYDPFFYSYIPPSVPVPSKTVTFINGRVVSFQFMERPYG